MSQSTRMCARCHAAPQHRQTSYCLACKRLFNQESHARAVQRRPPRPAPAATRPCTLCGVNPRNSSNKSYCVDCKRIKDAEARERRGVRVPRVDCQKCGQSRDGRHPTYCKDCYRLYCAGRLEVPCTRCGKERDKDDHISTAYCYDCWRNWWLLKKYGITSEKFDQMLAEQNGRCALCLQENNSRSWHVDHCHKTNINRKILCDNCNRGLGHMKDDAVVLRRAAAYIEEFEFLAMLFSD